MLEFYTRLFVEIDTTLGKLLQLVATDCNGTIDMMTVKLEEFEMDIIKSEYTLTYHDPHDFMSYSYNIEVVNIKEVSLDDYLIFVGKLMNKLYNHNAKIVASCDWEDDLPGHGKLI